MHVLEDTETETDAMGCVHDASETTTPWPSQQQQQQPGAPSSLSSTHSGSSSSPQQQDSGAAAVADDDPCSCPTTTTATAAAALSGMQLESCCMMIAQLQQPCYELDEDLMDMADLLLEELLAGDVPVGLMRMSSSCTNLAAAAADMQQPQQQQSCQDRAAHSCPLTPLHGCFAPAAAAAAPRLAPAPLSFNAAQQQDPEAELQVLLDKILQGAGQLEAPNAPTAAELHKRALQQCCDEFLLATASLALSAPPAGGYPATAQQQQQRPSYSTLSGPAGASAPGRASLDLTSHHAAVLRPAGLARQGSLLLHADRCHDAVLYVSAVAQAVLELSSALLSRYEHTQGQSD